MQMTDQILNFVPILQCMCDKVAHACLLLVWYLGYYRIGYDHGMCDTATGVKITFQKWSNECQTNQMINLTCR